MLITYFLKKQLSVITRSKEPRTVEQVLIGQLRLGSLDGFLSVKSKINETPQLFFLKEDIATLVTMVKVLRNCKDNQELIDEKEELISNILIKLRGVQWGELK